MILLNTNNSGYPRIADPPASRQAGTKEGQYLRRTISAWESGKKSDKELKDAQDRTVKEIIQEQLGCGIDIPTDGLIRWYDPVSHLLRKVKNVKINGLVRFYDTNFYFRQPVINGPVEVTDSILAEEFLFAKSQSAKPIKMVLTGPYTLSMLSINNFYKTKRELVMSLTELIANEVAALVKAGCELIQIDEPEIIRNPQDISLLYNALKTISLEKGNSKLALCTYFGDAASLYEKMQNFDVDILGFDLTCSKTLSNRIASSGSGKMIAFGIIDARNTRLENPKEIALQLEKMSAKLSSKLHFITPSCSLEYLPRDYAKEKLKILSQVKGYLV